MQQNFTILFDLDGTLVDTAPDLMRAHNHVMKKFGYPTKSTEEIRNLVAFLWLPAFFLEYAILQALLFLLHRR